MLIAVTQQDINEGIRGDGLWCPVAVGCRRAGLGGNVRVGVSTVRINYERINLPDEVVTWIAQFDRLGPPAVAPITFDLPLKHERA